MSRARGGRPRKYAAIRGGGGWAGAAEAELFWKDEPKNPHNEGTGDYYKLAQEYPEKRFSKSELEKRLGRSVPEAAWKEAEYTIGRYISRIRDHDSPRANNDKNDPNSFGATQKKWLRQLDRMTGEINAMFRARILDDFWGQYKLEHERYSYGPNRLHDHLKTALDALFYAIRPIAWAVPSEIELPHPAVIRRDAGRELKATAKNHDLPGKEFVKAFNIYADAHAPGGFSKWYQTLNKTD